MSAESFVQEVFQKNRGELDELRELLKVLEQLNGRKPRIYAVSVTSNA
jgi:hypothetical protein